MVKESPAALRVKNEADCRPVVWFVSEPVKKDKDL